MSTPISSMAYAPADVPFSAVWFEDATAAAKALGLDLELPDLGNADRAFWAQFDRKRWRDSLKGRVDMGDEEIDRYDADWVRLARYPTTNGPEIELWFDLEDGIVLRCTAATLKDVVALIDTAAQRAGLTLSENWPGNVVAIQRRAGAGVPKEEALRPYLEQAGFVWRAPSWTLADPAKRRLL